MTMKRRFWSHPLYAFFIIFTGSFLVYANSLNNSFHFDDQHYVVENPFIRDLGNIPKFFESPRYSSFEKVFTAHYRPLVVTSYALNYTVGGLSPIGYHLVNLSFHAGSAFLVFLIVSLLAREPLNPLARKEPGRFTGLAAGLIFAVHPVNSEVVNYITARSSVMCAFFYLLAFWCWMKYREPTHRLSWYLASLFAFLLSMLSKEIAITLPVMLWVYDLYFTGSPVHRFTGPSTGLRAGSRLFHWRFYFPYLPLVLMVAVPYLLIRKMHYGAMITSRLTREFWPNLITQTKVLTEYIRLFFVPTGLTIDHDIGVVRSPLDPMVIVSSVFLAAILTTAYLLYRKGGEWKIISFFILWFFITILPTTVLPLNAILQENRGYLSGVGFAIFAGIAMMHLGRRMVCFPSFCRDPKDPIPVAKRLPVAGGILLLVVYSLATFQRNLVWQNDVTLWTDAVKKAPFSPRAYDNLGLAYHRSGNRKKAEESYLKTLALNPFYGYAHYNLGVFYQEEGRWELAEKSYQQVLKGDPGFFNALYNLGIVYKNMGRYDDAIEVYIKATTVDSRYPFVYNNLGVVYQLKGENGKARESYRMAIQKSPIYDKAYYNMGVLLLQLGDHKGAADVFEQVLKINPDFEKAKKKLEELGIKKNDM